MKHLTRTQRLAMLKAGLNRKRRRALRIKRTFGNPRGRAFEQRMSKERPRFRLGLLWPLERHFLAAFSCV